jgi:hypothetical protein
VFFDCWKTEICLMAIFCRAKGAERQHCSVHVIEPAGLVMTRRMLLGLEQRAEALRAANTGETHAILGTMRLTGKGIIDSSR